MTPRGWEKPPFYVVALTGSMILASAALLGYAVIKLQATASRIEILRDTRSRAAHLPEEVREPAVPARERPGIDGRLFVTDDRQQEIQRLLSGSGDVRVLASELDRSAATYLETAQAFLVPFTVEVEGPFPAVAAYLSSLDRALWLIVTEDVRINASEDEGGGPVTHAGIRGYVYWR